MNWLDLIIAAIDNIAVASVLFVIIMAAIIKWVLSGEPESEPKSYNGQVIRIQRKVKR